LLKENIVLKWVHRFGIDSLNNLLIHTPSLREYQLEEENQEQTNLMDEVDEEEIKLVSKPLEPSSIDGIFRKDQNSNNIKQITDNQKLPLPNIKNLRKWINNDKKAS